MLKFWVFIGTILVVFGLGYLVAAYPIVQTIYIYCICGACIVLLFFGIKKLIRNFKGKV